MACKDGSGQKLPNIYLIQKPSREIKKAFIYRQHTLLSRKGGPLDFKSYTGYVNFFRPVGLSPSPANKVCFGPKRYVSMMGSLRKHISMFSETSHVILTLENV